jgi:hypothetical protein
VLGEISLDGDLEVGDRAENALALQAIAIRALRLPSGNALWETIVTEAYP